MAILLFPGRHFLNIRLLEVCLHNYLKEPLQNLPLLGERTCYGRIDEVIFAITSANQSNSRYNPIPLEIRAVEVNRLMRDDCAPIDLRSRAVQIPYYRPTPRFAEFMLKEIATEPTRLCSCPRWSWLSRL